MITSHFYNASIRRSIIAFGNLFNGLTIERNLNNTNVQTLPVPLAYGAKENWLLRLKDNPDLDKDVAITLPRIGFEITGMDYDGQRKLDRSKKNVVILSTDEDKLKEQYVPVPWNLNIDLTVAAKNAEDGLQIIEQILPFFQPDFTLTINFIPSMDNLAYDVPVILQSVVPQDLYEGNFEDRRAITWTLSFVMKSFVFGPVSSSGVIKRAQTDFYFPTTNTSDNFDTANTARSLRFEVQPGLLANGSPTSNLSLTIPASDIQANDNYGFIETVTDFEDGKRYSYRSGEDIDI